jgi:hypothetical protein
VADKKKFPKHTLREIILPNPWKIFYTNQTWILTPRKSHAHFKRREEKREKRRKERIATTIPAGCLLHISLAALARQEDSDLCR